MGYGVVTKGIMHNSKYNTRLHMLTGKWIPSLTKLLPFECVIITPLHPVTIIIRNSHQNYHYSLWIWVQLLTFETT